MSGQSQLSPEERKRMALEASRVGPAAVARKAGVRKETVQQWMRDAGVPRKNLSSALADKRSAELPAAAVGYDQAPVNGDIDFDDEERYKLPEAEWGSDPEEPEHIIRALCVWCQDIWVYEGVCEDGTYESMDNYGTHDKPACHLCQEECRVLIAEAAHEFFAVEAG